MKAPPLVWLGAAGWLLACAGAPRTEGGEPVSAATPGIYTFEARIPVVHVSLAGRSYENEPVFGTVAVLENGLVQLESSHGTCTSREPLRPNTNTVRISCGTVAVSFTPGSQLAPGRVTATVRERTQRRGQCRHVSDDGRSCAEWDWFTVDRMVNRSAQAPFQRSGDALDVAPDTVGAS